MKKPLFVGVLLFALICISSTSFSQILINEDFSSAPDSITPPSGWTSNDLNSSGEVWRFDNPDNRALNSPINSPAAIFDSDFYGGGTLAEDAALESPAFDASSGPILLSFDHYFRALTGSSYIVEVFNGTKWDTLLIGTASTSNPQSELFDITTLTGGATNAQVRFRFIGNFSWYWILDNVQIEAVSCFPPTGLGTVSTTNTSATVFFTSGGAPNANIEYGPAGFTPGSGTILMATNDTVTINGLSPGINYDFYVQDSCGVGNSSSFTGPFSFSTQLCTAPCSHSVTLYDSYGDGWNGTVVTVYQGGVAVGTVGPGFTSTTGNPNGEEFGTSISLCGASTAYFVITTGSNGSPNYSEEIGIDVSDPFGNPLGSYSANPSADQGDTILIVSPNCTPPSCMAPSNLGVFNISNSSASFYFTSGGASHAIVEYGPAGFSPGSGTEIVVANDTVSLTALTAGTSYDVYVKDSCGTGNVSTLSGPVSFTTAACAGACSHPVILHDSFGDSWNGAEVSVYQNGNLISLLDFPSGVGSPAGDTLSTSVLLCPGLPVYFVLTDEGGFPSELGLTVNTPFGTLAGDYDNTSSTAQGDTLISFVVNCTPPACPAPSSPGVFTVTQTSATIFFTSGGASNANIEYGPAGFTQGTGTVVMATNDTIALTGLNPNTSYDFYVQDSCGAGDVSSWVGPVSFTTLCQAITSFPAHEDFEGATTGSPGVLPACWSRKGTSAYQWHVNSGTTISSNTGPSADHSLGTASGVYAYTEASNGSPGDTAFLNIPAMNISSLTAPELAFWYHMYGSAISKLQVEIWNTTTLSWDSVYAIVGQQQTATSDPWKLAIIDLSAYSSNNVQIRFFSIKGSGALDYEGDVALDDISVREKPSCSAPMNLGTLNTDYSSATIYFTSGGAANANIEYGPAGFTPGTGTLIAVTNDTVTIGGLMAGTTYQFYVQDSCGAGNVSTFTGPGQFSTTTCPAPANFGSFNVTTTSVNVFFSSSANDFDIEYGPAGFTPGTGTPLNVNNDTVMLTSLTAATNYDLYVSANCAPGVASDTAGPFTFNTNVCDSANGCLYPVVLYDDFGDGWNGTEVTVYQAGVAVATLGSGFNSSTGNPAGDLFNDTILLCDAADAYFVVSTGSTGSPYYSDEIYLDVFTPFGTIAGSYALSGTTDMGDTLVTVSTSCAPPSCPSPSNLGVVSTGYTSATVYFTSGGASNANIEYGPSGFTQGTGSLLMVTNDTATITGLMPGTSYDFYVQDSCGAGNVSTFTGPGQFSTTTCPAPANFGSFNVTTTSVNVFFSSSANDFDIEYGPAGFTPGTGTPLNVNNDTVMLTSLTAATNYDLYVSANCAPGVASDTAGPFTFNTNVCDSANGCLYPVVLYDDFGDGWNGTEVTVYQSGVAVATLGSGFNSSTGNPAGDLFNDTILLCDAADAYFVVSTGSTGSPYYSDEIYLDVFTPFGTIAGSYALSGTTDMGDTLVTVSTSCAPPSCSSPSNLGVMGTNNNEATIYYTSGGASNADVKYGITGFALSSGTIMNVGNDTATIAGLLPGTTYDFYVRDSCGPGNSSNWQGPESFTTTICDTANACVHPITLHDFYGDGWNGTEVTVYQNNTAVGVFGPGFTSSTGSPTGDTLETSLSLCEGIPTFFVITKGSNGSPNYSDEIGINLYRPGGQLVVQYDENPSADQGDTIISVAPNCAPCPTPTTISATASICSGDSILLGKSWQTTTGIYTDIIDDRNGCDSIITNTALTVHPSYSSTTSASICQGDSLFVGGAHQTVSGVYSDTLFTTNGCDSVITTNLTVLPAPLRTQSAEICNGDSLLLGGAYQTASGVYTDVFTTANGCDSTVVTTLNVLPSYLINASATICQGDSILIAGAYRHSAGSYSDSMQTGNGCDSIIFTTLNVLPTSTSSVSSVICQGDSILLGGSYQTIAGFYTDVYTSSNGCDSTVITTLQVNPVFNTAVTVNICQGDSAFVGGAYQTGDGLYTDSLSSVSGCDSIITTTLIVNPAPITTSSMSICQGDSVFLAGAYQTTAGVYSDSLSTINGCDSIILTTLIVLPAKINQVLANICQGDSVFVGGAYQTTAGVYTDVYTAANGCDSTVVTNVQVNPSYSQAMSLTICEGDSVLLAGTYQTMSGTFTDSLATVDGCDSLIITSLNVLPITTTTMSSSICQGDSLFIGGKYQNTTGVYYDTLMSSDGCDSILATSLSIIPNVINNVSLSICKTDSVFVGGAYQNMAGTYTDVYPAANGCDSILVTSLTILPTPTVSTTAGICAGDSIYLGGAYQSIGGVYFDTLATTDGCDSIVITTLAVGNVKLVTTNISICDGDSALVSGNYVHMAGTYNDTLSTSSGCDSVYSTVVTVLPSSAANRSMSICSGDSIYLGGNYQTMAGTYIDTLTGTNGCDSVLTTTLNIIPPIVASNPVTICNGDSVWTGSGYVYSSGTYNDTLTSGAGCDSIVSTVVTVLPNTTVSASISICQGDSVFVGGSYQNVAGSYSDIYVAANGCDSIVTTTVTVLPSTSGTASIAICQGDSAFVGGGYQTVAGIYRDTLTASNSCDSIVSTSLSLLPTASGSATMTICQGDSALIFGSYETSAGSYSQNYASGAGCDSIYTINLVVNPTSSSTVSTSICDGDSLYIAGAYRTTTGSFMETLTGTNGCDSTVTTNLSVIPVSSSLASVAICQGDSVLVGGVYQTMAGTYTDTLSSSQGCDSIVSTTVTVNPTYSMTVMDSICPGDSLFVGGAYQTTAGNYSDIYSSSAGCDSTVITMLSIRTDTGCTSGPPAPVCTTVVSDNSWSMSTTVTPTNYSGNWNGASSLPAAATFINPVNLGQPYGYPSIQEVEGSNTIISGNSIRYFRKEFMLSSTNNLNVRILTTVDDQADIYLNGHRVALITRFGRPNFKFPAHDLKYNSDGTVQNGFMGGEAFNVISGADMDTLLKTGINDLVVVVRNLGKPNDLGGFAFRMDINCNDNAITQKSSDAGFADFNKLHLFPNPVTDVLTVGTELAINHIRLFDVNGKVIFDQQYDAEKMVELNMEDLAKGVYLIEVTELGEEVQVEKITKL